MKVVTVHLISASYSLHTPPAAHAEPANNMIITQATWFIHWTKPFYSSCSSVRCTRDLWNTFPRPDATGYPAGCHQLHSLKAFHRPAERLSENSTAGSSVCWGRLRRFYHLLFVLIGFEEIKLACFIFKWSENSPIASVESKKSLKKYINT